MIIRNDDLNKTRYTRRDYESIKEDLISAIPSLTQEWTSRESADPGIVLIKLMSMFGDTLSYNIDKIALELYIDSVTQRKNCSKILRLLGYKTKWYQSGRVLAHIRLVRPTTSTGREHAILVPYETELYAGSTKYTVIQQSVGGGEIDIASSTRAESVMLVEGTAVTLSFDGKSMIDNRYYFNASNVDEKEILLRTDDGTYCELVDNLYFASSSRVIYFEFDIDEYERPYIRLSDGWEDILKSSGSTMFTLTYILSSGSQGNISSNAFTRVIGLKEGEPKDLIITNLPNTVNYEDGVSETYNSPGRDPQTVEEARHDSSNYVFTYDTLVTPSDYEKACRRISNVTMSKLVDGQVILNEGLDLDEISQRALDDWTVIDDLDDEGETRKYLEPYQSILYVGYRNFDLETNYYYSTPASSTLWDLSASDNPEDPYNSIYYRNEEDPSYHPGYYPYRIKGNIALGIKDSLDRLKTLNVSLDFGTLKLFPFKVKGTLHLIESKSPEESLQVVRNVNDALSRHYYPDKRLPGERPNFIEIVDIIQNCDNRIKYFDAIGNIVQWAPEVLLRSEDFEDIFDTTSAIVYNGLDDTYGHGRGFNLHKRFLRYKFKNAGVTTDHEDYGSIIYGTEDSPQIPEDYGTTYLFEYSKVANILPVVRIDVGTSRTIQLNNTRELEALCEDLKFKGKVQLNYSREEGTVSTESLVVSENGDPTVYILNSGTLLKALTWTGHLESYEIDGERVSVIDPEVGYLDESTITSINDNADYTRELRLYFEFQDDTPTCSLDYCTFTDTLLSSEDEVNVVSKTTVVNNLGTQWVKE